MDPHAFVAASKDYSAAFAALDAASRADTPGDAALLVEAARTAICDARATPNWVEPLNTTTAFADRGAAVVEEITSRWPLLAGMWEELTGQEFPWIW
jgi:hypothetical protein